MLGQSLELSHRGLRDTLRGSRRGRSVLSSPAMMLLAQQHRSLSNGGRHCTEKLRGLRGAGKLQATRNYAEAF